MATAYEDRIRELDAHAREFATVLDPDPPDDELAADVVRLGVGPTVALYCEARTGADWHRFERQQFRRLQATFDRWLACYGACYGVDLSGSYSLRTAAELLVDTHDARAVAAVLTGVPGR
ncbi:hypothetical protein [Haloarcula onubensis]|uniref:DUF8055 domain-containing protein n=1 Tax=Haloarcula onubensis TaxID=2950539 RepID=A0ABU2FTP5_9EURY|nr:hypothetical protein [Halomicroarcula sp. S3CR25-11]MDS0284143.1 hypothetical protein [Halomicroarcula sp. S3CR25-11]